MTLESFLTLSETSLREDVWRSEGVKLHPFLTSTLDGGERSPSVQPSDCSERYDRGAGESRSRLECSC